MRVLFVDVLRLIALLQMVNGHTLDALLAWSARQGAGFERYTYARGLVSVAFLVVAGISFHLTTVARFARHRADPEAIRRRFVRAAQVIGLGYLLQVQWSGAYFDPARAPAALRSLFRCEVLQCIGLALLALELGVLFARSARGLSAGALGGAVAVFAATPAAERLAASGPPSLLRGLVGHAHGSQFPLFPWAGYVFAGVAIGALALPDGGRTKTSHRVWMLTAIGAAVLLASRVLHALPLAYGSLRAASVPWFVLEKLALIAFALAALAWCTRRLRALPRSLAILGGETLAIFVFHLHVIYGGRWALAPRFGRTLDWPEALAAAVFNIALSAAFGFAYHALKQRVKRWGTRPAQSSLSLSASQAD